MESIRDQPQAADLLCLRGEGWAERGMWTSCMEPALRGGRVGEGKRCGWKGKAEEERPHLLACVFCLQDSSF